MRGPFSTPITPLPGSLFHADPQPYPAYCLIDHGDVVVLKLVEHQRSCPSRPTVPTFNPIEKALARLKACCAGPVSAQYPSFSLIGRLVNLFQPKECANYFSSCGYDSE